MPLLEVENLHIAYKEIEAVKGVSFHISEGELVSIVGANGAGKTSILNAIMGLVSPKEGKIKYKGNDITGTAAHERAKMGIRIVPEKARLFPQLTVWENLMTGIYGIKKQVPLQERLDWIYELFPILKEREKQAAVTLSGGEQQQVAIARALISDPDLLLVDEISMGLMPILVDRVFEVLQELNRKHGKTVLLVEQNALASLEISTRAYVLETGEITFSGTAEEVASDPRIHEAYLGG
ncbi:ABC transporter related protein [Thermovirga lienii DSM 17291]|jgi:branched-chain amino acid transport system ATP-binding protein|uniref:ABC transporter related protein n=1 Tax=Thermovirga lienii (strain ATCC BAA-1197 / DSM 17291 / Cas60314) TaxID=580340 RepID=G7VA52_THELD|nr:ABC transporter ATP-binding protein [Thermovirga lienii]AER66752.1 ABC transporter related protein [Thermovirga lienii DSM 17291]MDN5318297.1 branched-chain amino acid transport system ATP-binding protein [Thermovirga sp.]HCD71000.1 ABC transporter ATP-binding protein [Thermovirga lienii]